MSLENIHNNVVNGQASAVEDGVKSELEAGTSPEKILNEALIAAMDYVG